MAMTKSPAKWKHLLETRAQEAGAPYMTPSEISEWTGVPLNVLHQGAYMGQINRTGAGKYVLDQSLIDFIVNRSSNTYFKVNAASTWLEVAMAADPPTGKNGVGPKNQNAPTDTYTSDKMLQSIRDLNRAVIRTNERIDTLFDLVGTLRPEESIPYRRVIDAVLRSSPPKDVLGAIVSGLFGEDPQ